MPHEAVDTPEHDCLLHDAHEEQARPPQQGRRSPCQRQTGISMTLLNSLDHADLPRRHNKDVDDLKGTSTTLSTGQQGNLNGNLNGMDHVDQPVPVPQQGVDDL